MSLETIANLAGVSKTTVHRVLKNSSVVSPVTVEVVLRAMKKAGYVPNGKGRRPSFSSFATDVSNINIGVLFYETRANSPLTARLLHGFEGPITRSHSRMTLMQYDGKGMVPDIITNREVDGLIVRPGLMGDQICKKLPSDYPAVWLFERRIGYRPEKVDCVGPDDNVVGQMAYQCLRQKGHRRMAIINSWSSSVYHHPTELRIAAFMLSARQEGIRVELIDGNENNESKITGLLSAPEPVTALYVCGEAAEVIPVYNLIQKHGLECGKDIDMLCCVQDIGLLRKVDSRVILIDIDSEAIAANAVDVLMWRLKNPSAQPRTVLLYPKILNEETVK